MTLRVFWGGTNMGTISSLMRQAVVDLLPEKPGAYRECKQCGRELDSRASSCENCGSNEIAEYEFSQ